MFKPSFEINIDELQATKSGIHGKIKADDQTDLAYTGYTLSQPHSCLIFYHGGGAHSLLGYTRMAQQLCDNFAIATYLFDIRGHGQSGGPRGYAPSKEQVWSDISKAIQFVKSQHPSTDVFLGGHSSGGGLTLNYSYWDKGESVKGYLLVAPELGPRIAKQKIKFADFNNLIFLLHKISMGYLFKRTLAVKLNYSREQIEKDGCVDGYNIDMVNALIAHDARNELISINKPTYILIADADEIINNDKLKELLLSATKINPNIIYKNIPGAKHIMILKDVSQYIGEYLSEM